MKAFRAASSHPLFLKELTMKYQWEEKDVVCGRFVCKNLPANKDSFEPDGWTAKWTFKVCYMGSSSREVCLVAMTDGMMGYTKTKEEMAAFLTENDMVPMPHKWLLQTMDYLRGCYDEGN